jgi:hypothetical protein
MAKKRTGWLHFRSVPFSLLVLFFAWVPPELFCPAFFLFVQWLSSFQRGEFCEIEFSKFCGTQIIRGILLRMQFMMLSIL